MTRLNIVLFGLLCALSATEAAAQTREVKVTVIGNCEPSAILDGSRVLEEAWDGSDCSSNRQITLRFVDYVVDAICYVKQRKCVLKADMNEREAQRFEQLRAYAKPAAVPYRHCITTDKQGTWQEVMLTGARVECVPSQHTMRVADAIAGTVCLFHYGQRVDCVKHERSRTGSLIAP